MAGEDKMTRRPIRARDTKWAAAAARFLARIGLRPNAISLLSIFFSALAALALVLAADGSRATTRSVLLVVAAACIPARLLCNLFDGMVAVEGGFKSNTGELYNEFPDRVSDALVLVAAGLFSGPDTAWLGVAAALAAVLTAYARTLGAAAGASQVFCGPMAKQQRMVLLAVACLFSIPFPPPIPLMSSALLLITVGCVVTIARRLKIIARELNDA